MSRTGTIARRPTAAVAVMLGLALVSAGCVSASGTPSVPVVSSAPADHGPAVVQGGWPGTDALMVTALATATKTTAAVTATVTATARRPTLLAVGDIGDCRAGGDRGAATAGLAATLPGPIALLGDIAYSYGTQLNYDQCFWPSWRPLESRVHAVIGNHDDRNRSVFFANWPRAGTSAKPWYAYTVGSWLVLVVDANCTTTSCSAGSPEVTWLKNTLASNRGRCTVLAMHQPRFSSDDEHGDSPAVDDLWRTAWNGGVDLVIAGHAHDYERIGPVGLTGARDPAGPVLLVVGTGGTPLRSFAKVTPASTVRIADTWGLARLTLSPGVWRSEFLAAPSGTVRDTASGTCR